MKTINAIMCHSLFMLAFLALFCGPSAKPTIESPPAAVMALPPPPHPERTGFTVMTYNLRVNTQEDVLSGRGWLARRDMLVRLIRDEAPDILMVQELGKKLPEAATNWFRNKLSLMTSEGGSFNYLVIAGAGQTPRDIYVNADLFQIDFPSTRALADSPFMGGCARNDSVPTCSSESTNTMFLPPDARTPCAFEPGLANQSAEQRSATWALVTHRPSGRQTALANLHLFHEKKAESDHRIRDLQFICVLDEIHATYPDMPIIIAGDFNMLSSSVEPILKTSQWDDSRERGFTNTENGQEPGTFNGFCESCIPNKKIDHILTRGFHVVEEGRVVLTKFDGQWPSDHCPVTAGIDFDIQPEM